MPTFNARCLVSTIFVLSGFSTSFNIYHMLTYFISAPRSIRRVARWKKSSLKTIKDLLAWEWAACCTGPRSPFSEKGCHPAQGWCSAALSDILNYYNFTELYSLVWWIYCCCLLYLYVTLFGITVFTNVSPFQCFCDDCEPFGAQRLWLEKRNTNIKASRQAYFLF